MPKGYKSLFLPWCEAWVPAVTICLLYMPRLSEPAPACMKQKSRRVPQNGWRPGNLSVLRCRCRQDRVFSGIRTAQPLKTPRRARTSKIRWRWKIPETTHAASGRDLCCFTTQEPFSCRFFRRAHCPWLEKPDGLSWRSRSSSWAVPRSSAHTTEFRHDFGGLTVWHGLCRFGRPARGYDFVFMMAVFCRKPSWRPRNRAVRRARH